MYRPTLATISILRTNSSSPGHSHLTDWTNLQTIATITVNLPDAEVYAQEKTQQALLEMGKVATAFTGILIIILVFKAFWKG